MREKKNTYKKGDGEGDEEEYRKAGRTQIIQEIFLTGRAFLLGTWKDNLEMNLRLQESEKKKAWIKWKKGSFRIKDLLAKCTRGASSRAQLPLGRVSIAPMT